MFKISILILSVLFISASCNSSANLIVSPPMTQATIGKVSIELLVADEPEEQSLGLGQRESLPENQGMIFIFSKLGKPVFWMKDVNFPIDIIWLKNNKVVEITKKVQTEIGEPDSSLEIYSPSVEADTVIEVNAGWSDRNNLKPGDVLTP